MSAPDVSLVIPSYGRPEALEQTLAHVGRLDFEQAGLEVIVVDDGSQPPLAPVIERARGGIPFSLILLTQSNQGVAAARNAGAERARGARLIFIDNDIHVAPDFVRRHLESERANPGAWIVGRVTNPGVLRATPFGRYRDDLYEAFAQGQGLGGVSEIVGLTGQNLAMPRADLLALGGFDRSFTIASCEDAELAMRARQRGIRTLFDPSIVVVHDDWAVDLPRFCERQRLYSVSDVLLWRKYGARSPRAALVLDNGPPRLGDRPRILVRKLAKGALASRLGQAACVAVAGVAEQLAPDSSLSRRAYDLAVGVAIVRGVREGLRRYPG